MLPTFCRVTGNSRNLPKPNYFPLLPPISPVEARRLCRLMGKAVPSEDHQYVPLIEFARISRAVKCHITSHADEPHHYQQLNTANHLAGQASKCRITAKHQINQDYRYLYPVFKDNSYDLKQLKKILDKMSSRLDNLTFQPGQRFVYQMDDNNLNLVLPVDMEAAIRRGEIENLLISKDGSSVLIRLKDGPSLTLKLTSMSPTTADGLLEGGGQDEEILAKQRQIRQYKKRKISDPRRYSIVQQPPTPPSPPDKLEDEVEEKMVVADWNERMAKLTAGHRSAANLLALGTDWRDLLYPKIDTWDFGSLPVIKEDDLPTLPVREVIPLDLPVETLLPGPVQSNQMPVMNEDIVGFEAVPVFNETIRPFKGQLPVGFVDELDKITEDQAASSTSRLKDLFSDVESLMFLPFLHEVAAVMEALDSGTDGWLVRNEQDGIRFVKTKPSPATVSKSIGGRMVPVGKDEERFVVGQQLNKFGFVPGKMVNDQFQPGCVVQNPEGAGFIPGCIFDKAFAAGQIIRDGPPKFVSGQAVQTLFGPKFLPGRTIQTDEGLKFVAGQASSVDNKFHAGQIFQTANGPTFISGVTFDTPQGARFIAGQTDIDGQFVAGQVLMDESNGKLEFMAGENLETADGPIFLPGQSYKTPDGRTKFCPGRQMILEDGQKRFVPGETMISKEGRQFVAGVLAEERFIPCQIDPQNHQLRPATKEEDVYFCAGLDDGLPIDNSTFSAMPRKKPDMGYMIQHEDKVKFLPTEQNQESLLVGNEAIKVVPGQLLEMDDTPKFIPGKTIESALGNIFIPGQAVRTGPNKVEQFVPGQVIDTGNSPSVEGFQGPMFCPGQMVNCESGKKFVPGQVFGSKTGPRFVPGKILMSPSGVSTFIPGQVVYSSDRGSVFVPGNIVDTSSGPFFVPGRVVDLPNGGIKFVAGEIIETDSGPRYVTEHETDLDLLDETEDQKEIVVQGFPVTPEELRLITAYPFAALHYPLKEGDGPIINSRMLRQMAAAGVAVNKLTNSFPSSGNQNNSGAGNAGLNDVKVVASKDIDEAILGADVFRTTDPVPKPATKKAAKDKTGTNNADGSNKSKTGEGKNNKSSDGAGGTKKLANGTDGSNTCTDGSSKNNSMNGANSSGSTGSKDPAGTDLAGSGRTGTDGQTSQVQPVGSSCESDGHVGKTVGNGNEIPSKGDGDGAKGLAAETCPTEPANSQRSGNEIVGQDAKIKASARTEPLTKTSENLNGAKKESSESDGTSTTANKQAGQTVHSVNSNQNGQENLQPSGDTNCSLVNNNSGSANNKTPSGDGTSTSSTNSPASSTDSKASNNSFSPVNTTGNNVDTAANSSAHQPGTRPVDQQQSGSSNDSSNPKNKQQHPSSPSSDSGKEAGLTAKDKGGNNGDGTDGRSKDGLTKSGETGANYKTGLNQQATKDENKESKASDPSNSSDSSAADASVGKANNSSAGRDSGHQQQANGNRTDAVCSAGSGTNNGKDGQTDGKDGRDRDDNSVDRQVMDIFEKIKRDLDSVEHDPFIRQTLADAEALALASGRPDLADKVRQLLDILKNTERDPEVVDLIKQILRMRRQSQDQETDLLGQQANGSTADSTSNKSQPANRVGANNSQQGSAQSSAKAGQNQSADSSSQQNSLNGQVDPNSPAGQAGQQLNSKNQKNLTGSAQGNSQTNGELNNQESSTGQAGQAGQAGQQQLNSKNLKNQSASAQGNLEINGGLNNQESSTGQAGQAGQAGQQPTKTNPSATSQQHSLLNGVVDNQDSSTEENGLAGQQLDQSSKKSGSLKKKGNNNKNTSEQNQGQTGSTDGDKSMTTAVKGGAGPAACSLNGSDVSASSVAGSGKARDGVDGQGQTTSSSSIYKADDGQTEEKSPSGVVGEGAQTSTLASANGTSGGEAGGRTKQRGKQRNTSTCDSTENKQLASSGDLVSDPSATRPTELKGLKNKASELGRNSTTISPVIETRSPIDESKMIDKWQYYNSPISPVDVTKALLERSGSKDNNNNNNQGDKPAETNNVQDSQDIFKENVRLRKISNGRNPRRVTSRSSSRLSMFADLDLSEETGDESENYETIAPNPVGPDGVSVIPNVITSAKDISREVIDTLRYSRDEAKKELYTQKILEAVGLSPSARRSPSNDSDGSRGSGSGQNPAGGRKSSSRSRKCSSAASACIILKDFLQTIVPSEAAHNVLIGDIDYMVIDDEGVRYFESAMGFASRRNSRFDIRQAATTRSRSGSQDQLADDATSGPWPWADVGPRSRDTRRASIDEFRKRLMEQDATVSKTRSPSRERPNLHGRHSVAAFPVSRTNSGYIPQIKAGTSRRGSLVEDYAMSAAANAAALGRKRKVGTVDQTNRMKRFSRPSFDAI